MNEQRDLGVTLIGAAMLMLSMVYLAQCSARTPAPEPTSQTAAAQSAGGTGAKHEAERGAAEKEDNEEAVRVKNIGHALQTIGADPELRKTYGFK